MSLIGPRKGVDKAVLFELGERLVGEQPIIKAHADAVWVTRLFAEGIHFGAVAAEIARKSILASPSVLHWRWHGEALDAILGDRPLVRHTRRPPDATVPVHAERALTFQGVLI